MGARLKNWATLEKELGSAFCGIAGNAADSDVLERLFAAAVERFGRPADIVVANAGRGLGGSVKDADLSQFEDVIKINVTGALALLRKPRRKWWTGNSETFRKRRLILLFWGRWSGGIFLRSARSMAPQNLPSIHWLKGCGVK